MPSASYTSTLSGTPGAAAGLRANSSVQEGLGVPDDFDGEAELPTSSPSTQYFGEERRTQQGRSPLSKGRPR